MQSKKPEIVAQIEIAELESLKSHLREAKRLYVAKRSEIMQKLASGAEVEAGPYRAEVRVAARLSVE